MRYSTTIVRFGSMIVPGQTECGHPAYIQGFGMKPQRRGAHLQVVGEREADSHRARQPGPIYEQIMGGRRALEADSNPGRLLGPYSDVDNSVERFAATVRQGQASMELLTLVNRLIDCCRPVMIDTAPDGTKTRDIGFEQQFPRETFTFSEQPPFVYDPERLLLPVVLPTAGEVLTSATRKAPSSLGGEVIVTTHALETWLVAIAVLRASGYDAFLAEGLIAAADARGGIISTPLIAVLNPGGQAAVMTFNMVRMHPAMEALAILSDMEVEGATYAAYAQSLTRLLAVEIVERHRTGNDPDKTELDQRFGAIASTLYEAHVRWPGCHYIHSALIDAHENLTHALVAMNDEFAQLAANAQAIASGQYQQQLGWLVRLSFNPEREMAKLQRRVEEIQQGAVGLAHQMVAKIQEQLNAKVQLEHQDGLLH